MSIWDTERNRNISERRHRKPGFKEQAIDVNELADMSNVKGMLSFLDTKPEEYARLFATQPPSSLPSEPIDKPELSRSLPESTFPSGSNLLPDSTVLPEGNLQAESDLQPDSSVPPGSSLPPDSNLLANTGLEHEPRDSNFLPGSELLSGGSLLSGSELRTVNGRTVRIRQARSVQDAHTPGEHMLLTMMWKKGSPESEESRLLKAGLAELARWTGSHKTSCRAYLRALTAKLAIEEAETFNAAAGKDGARVYRIYSFAAILERRRRANLTHVIRTGAVTFVDPTSGARLLPDSKLLPDRTQQPGAKLLADSNLPADSGSSQAPQPDSNLPPRIKKEKEEATTSASPSVIRAIQVTLGYADDDAARLITRACRAKAKDATEAEIAYFIGLHGSRIRRMRHIENPLGLLIHHVPKCFEGEAFRQFREAERQRREAEERRRKEALEECQRILNNPVADESDRDWARQTLEMLEPEN